MESTTTHESDLQATLLAGLRDAVALGDIPRARQLAQRMLDDEALALLEDLRPAELSRLFAILGDEILARLLGSLDERDAASILSRMTAAQAADILEEIDPDDAADIVGELREEHEPAIAEDILVAMEPAEAAELRELLTYPPESAGGLMTPAFVAVYPDLRADEAIVALRRVAEEAETVNYVYVVDQAERLLGVLSLHSLVLTRPSTLVRDLMITDVLAIPVDTDQEEAARALLDRDYLALPVIEHDGRLVGIITQDDVADVLEEEATEDIERLGGSQPLDMPYRQAGPVLLIRRRIGWLLFLFLAGLLTSQVLQSFDSELSRVESLIAFIPLIVGIGGNVGSQTVTTLVRALAVGEVQLRDVGWVVGKELSVGLGVGLIMGLAGLLRVGLDEGVAIGIVVSATIICVTAWSSTVAAVLPLVLRRLKVDPAVVSAPLISTFVDATGLLIYLTIARLVLTQI